jgi:hypothetical protein
VNSIPDFLKDAGVTSFEEYDSAAAELKDCSALSFTLPGVFVVVENGASWNYGSSTTTR